MNIHIKKLYADAKLPERGSDKAAGYDLRVSFIGTSVLNPEDPDITCDNIIIAPHTTLKIGTGIAAEIPEGYYGAIFARSGLATKTGLRPANCVGVIDSDYRGEFIVALHNDSDEKQIIHNGDRIAQLVVMPFLPVTFTVVSDLDETKRGEGGFGSTGKD